MRYKTLTYQRVKNLGNFESARLEATVELDENDFSMDCFCDLRDFVERSLDEVQTQPKVYQKLEIGIKQPIEKPTYTEENIDF